MLGLRVLYPGVRFDLVISGINRGDNLGLHVVYSGTVAGAREGAMRVDAVGIAISLCSYSRSADYAAAAAECAAELAAEIADAPALARALRGRVLTVNVPAVPRRDIRGIKLTRPGVELRSAIGCASPARLRATSPTPTPTSQTGLQSCQSQRTAPWTRTRSGSRGNVGFGTNRGPRGTIDGRDSISAPSTTGSSPCRPRRRVRRWTFRGNLLRRGRHRREGRAGAGSRARGRQLRRGRGRVRDASSER